MYLKRYSRTAEERTVTDKDRSKFKTVDFDPNELIQLKEMNKRELQLLMKFCGIRVFNGVPFVVMEENEMRMAYIVWRADQINEKKREWSVKLERGMKWTNHLLNAAKLWTRSI